MTNTKAIFAPTRWLTATAFTVIALAAAAAALQLLRADLRASIYQDRLHALGSDYTNLRDAYNHAVARTAVTELIVSDDNTLAVRIRDAAGRQSLVQTPFDPTQEIYIDYVIADARLLIRRIFDESTPPAQGLLLDHALADMGWTKPEHQLNYGKAVYRALAPGRWVVNVSGDGSLGLEQLPSNPDTDLQLTYAPAIGTYEQWLDATHQAADDISFKEAIAAFFSP